MALSLCLRRIDFFRLCVASGSVVAALLSALEFALSVGDDDDVFMEVMRCSKDLRNWSAYSAGGMVDSGCVSKHDLNPRAVVLVHVQLCVCVCMYVYIYIVCVCVRV